MVTELQILIVSSLLALILFTFLFWRDSVAEGFSSDKIFDAIILIIIFAIIGGKVLFREISVDYFKYEILSSPFIMEGVLVGGGFGLFLSIKKNKWSARKIGDMIAPALAAFQTVLFFGFWLSENNWASFVIFTAFAALYIFIRFLKNKKFFGSSSRFYELRRINKLAISGSLLVVYLTVSSLIAMLFLVINLQPGSRFWWFQVLFYLFVLFSTLIFFNKKLKK